MANTRQSRGSHQIAVWRIGRQWRGGYTITLMYRLSHEIVNRPDRTWAFLGGFDWHVKFLEPVRSGDRLHERITILEKRLSSKPGRGIVKHLIEVINDRKRVVLSIESTMLIATSSQSLVGDGALAQRNVAATSL